MLILNNVDIKVKINCNTTNTKTPIEIIWFSFVPKHQSLQWSTIAFAAENEVIIDGYIDRLDAFRSGDDVYVRVIDYKTGIKNFSLDDIQAGENLQMLLYLASIMAKGKEKYGENYEQYISPIKQAVEQVLGEVLI